MSDKTLARRTPLQVFFGGVDISTDVNRRLISLTYTDAEEDEADDLQIALEDADGVVLTSWLPAALAEEGFLISAAIVRENWNSDGVDDVLDCGTFEFDSADPKGPPSTVTIKSTSLPYSVPIRQTKKNKAWEKYRLSGIAGEMARNAGMTVMFESAPDPFYERVEQVMTPDIVFLQGLCKKAGISLKATAKMLVLFDAAAYEQKPAVRTIRHGDGTYGDYSLGTGSRDTKYSACEISYTNAAGKTLTYKYTPPDVPKGGQTLKLRAKASTAEEAKALAKKALRERNKYASDATFDFPGDPYLLAGVTVILEGWGFWDGKYIVKKATHRVTASSGYETSVELRPALEGY